MALSAGRGCRVRRWTGDEVRRILMLRFLPRPPRAQAGGADVNEGPPRDHAGRPPRGSCGGAVRASQPLRPASVRVGCATLRGRSACCGGQAVAVANPVAGGSVRGGGRRRRAFPCRPSSPVFSCGSACAGTRPDATEVRRQSGSSAVLEDAPYRAGRMRLRAGRMRREARRSRGRIESPGSRWKRSRDCRKGIDSAKGGDWPLFARVEALPRGDSSRGLRCRSRGDPDAWRRPRRDGAG